MKTKLVFALAIALVLVVATAFAGTRWVKIDGPLSTDLPQVVTKINNAQEFSFRVHIPRFAFKETTLNDQLWDLPDFRGAARHSMPGEPAVPVFTRYIAVPQGATINVTVNAGKVKKLTNVNCQPAQAPDPECYGEPEPEFEIDNQIYAGDDLFPGKLYKTEGPFIVRGLRMIMLHIYPVQVRPQSGEALLYPDLDIKVTFSGSKGVFFSEKRARSFQPLYDLAMNRMVYSQEPMPQSRGKSANGAEYVIICPPVLEDAANALAAWKNIQGYDTEVYTTDDTGTSVAAIKAWVQNAYDTWDPAPEFILFLGDAEYISPTYDGTASDRYYCTTEGGDEWVEIFSGRISVDTPAEANKRIQDIIDYERDPIYDTGYYTNSYHAAYFQHMGGGEAQRRFARTSEETYRWFDEYLTDSPLTPHRVYVTGSSVNPMYWNQSTYQWTPLWWTYGDYEIPEDIQKPNLAWDGGVEDIAAGVNAGTVFLTHRDHGSPTGWADPEFYIDDVNALTNGDKQPSVWSINCSTGQFDDETKKDGPADALCFSESWERQVNGGAVGVLASTRVSYSGRNDRMFWGWLDSHWPDFEPEWPIDAPNEPEWRMGIVLEYGKMYMSYHYADDPYRLIGIEEFHWFGDPTMEMYAGVPQEFSVSHLPLIPAGSLTFEVDAGIEDALVALSQNGVLIGKAYSGPSGEATVEFAEALTNVDDVKLIITRRQYRPHEADLLVGATSDGIIGLDKNAYRDGDTAELSLSDADLAGQGTYNLLIYSDTEPAGELVACAEFEDMGAFFGSITITDAAPVEANGVLSAGDGDTITLYYYDEDTGSGSPAEKTDTAYADTAPPTFAGLATIQGGDTKITLSWNAGTDLTPPITYQLYRAETSGGQNFTAPVAETSEINYVDSGLPNFVRYYYVVRATDAFGHQDTNMIELSDWTVGPMVIWEEDFDDNESGIPDTWEIIDGGTTGHTWNSENPGGRTNSNWDGVFAIADSDYTGMGVIWNDSLITEPIDCEGNHDIRLVFSHYYNYYSGTNDHAIIDISNDGGSSWANLVDWTGGDRSGIEDMDISAYADEQADVRIKFTYTGEYDYYWGIDNLQLIGIGAPTADFTADVTTGEVPLEVTFELETQGIVNDYLWEFGDGGTSTVENPTHTYEEARSFNVAVTVSGMGGSRTVTKPNFIVATCPTPTIDFEANTTTGEVPLEVIFTDLTSVVGGCEPTNVLWHFGDGDTSTDANPTHTYSDEGTFTVKLTYTTSYGTFNETKTGYITVECAAPVAAFEADVTLGDAPLTVQFTDLSTAAIGCEISTWAWTFTDADGNEVDVSSEQNPEFTFTDAGVYTVTLSVTNAAGTDETTEIDYITVDDTGDDDDDDDDDDTGDDDDDDNDDDDDASSDDDDDDNDDNDDGCGC